MTSEELAREVEYHKLLDALAAVKKGKDRDKLHEAKMALFTFREAERARPRTSPIDRGVATPATLKVKAKGN